jgi:hypothetical protein
MRRFAAATVVAVLLAAACSAGATLRGAPSGSTSAPASPSPAPHHTTPPPPTFRGTAAAIDPATRARMRWSWRPGCPVPLEDLRLLSVTYWGFDRAVHEGELVVNEDAVAAVLRVMRALFEARFPIARMRLVDAYHGVDDRSTASDNTSAFNCRIVAGHPGVWSQHAYGRAIDINPLENPEVLSDGTVVPPAGVAYVDRSKRAKGMILPGGVVVRAFADVGWGWGANWASFKDYQHFSATGG